MGYGEPYGIDQNGDPEYGAKPTWLQERIGERDPQDSRSQSQEMNDTLQQGLGDMPVLGGLANMAGFSNPNDTKAGKALTAQKGHTISWMDTASLGNQLFGKPYMAYGVDPVNWKQAQVTTANPTMMDQAAQANAASMQGSQMDLGQSNQMREGQGALVASLQGTAAGVGPSVAQEQLRQTTAANIANQASAAQAAHGAARLVAMRNAAANQAQIQQQANSQAAGLRAQEIQGAQSNLGNALGLTRSQDIGSASTNAQLAQQAAIQNASNLQATNMLNAQFGQQTGLSNQQAANQFALQNALSQNNAAQNYATQFNSGQQALSLAELQSKMATQQINFQQNQALLGAAQRAAQGQTDISTTEYTGSKEYDKDKREMTGSMMNKIGGGMLGGI